jgi:hypothetical protein
MSLLRTPWFALIELQVLDNGRIQAQFADQPQLTTLVDQEIRILAVETYTDQVLSVAPSGLTVAPLAELQKATLMLIDDDKQKVYQYPVLGLNRIYSDPGNFIPHQIDLQLFENLRKIAWTKSGCQFMAQTANAPYSIVFGIHYEKLEGTPVKM